MNKKTYASQLYRIANGLGKLAKKFETKAEELKFWREKKKTAYKHLERAKATNNGGWIKMLEKRIEKYKKKIKSLT